MGVRLALQSATLLALELDGNSKKFRNRREPRLLVEFFLFNDIRGCIGLLVAIAAV